MGDREKHLKNESLKNITSYLNDLNNKISKSDEMIYMMRRNGMTESLPDVQSTPIPELTNIDESETPEQQFANDVNKRIVEKVEKQYNIQQYHKKYNIPYPMSEVKRKRNRLKRKKLKKLNRK